MTDQTWDDNTPSYRPNWRDRRDMAAAVEALARAICPRVSQPGYCDKCERAAEAILADPAPLLAALVEAGVLERAARQAEYGRVRDVYAARWKAPAD